MTQKLLRLSPLDGSDEGLSPVLDTLDGLHTSGVTIA